MVFSAFGLQKCVFGLVCFSFIVCGTYVCSCTWMQTLTCGTMWSQMAACSACTRMQTLMLQDNLESDGSLQGQSPPVSFKTGFF